MKSYMLIIFGLFLAQSAYSQKSPHTFPDDCWGVYSWGSFNPERNNPEKCPLIKGSPIILHWKDVEPEPGDFRFRELMEERLEWIEKYGYYTFITLWFVPNTPAWVFEKGVPALKMTPTVNPFRKQRDWTFPYYLDPDYKKYYYRAIRELGQYILGLPDHLQERILFVQSAEGTTGDGFWYKGEPIDKRYTITHDQWGQFRRDAWAVFQEALSDEHGTMVVPLLVNYDSNREQEYDWLEQNFDVVGLKNGMFSHGYHISHTTDRLAHWNQYRAKLAAEGKQFFSRGEQDREWNICGWSKQNPEQAFYWSSIFASHCGLSMWNIPGEANQGTRFRKAMDFFNRHAGQYDPEHAKTAFCALRKGLDVSDTQSYPEVIYGEAVKKNSQRYLEIVEAHSHLGAIQGDPPKAIGDTSYMDVEGAKGVTTNDGMMNRQREDYNDAGWKIWPGNYARYLTQIDPENTSLGRWHAGPEKSIYGRFARSTDVAHGKNILCFDLDDSFYDGDGTLAIKVIWLDQGNASWQLKYDAKSEPGKTAMEVTNENTGQWKEKTISLSDALMQNRCDLGADLVLQCNPVEDLIVHLLEVEKLY